MSTAPSQLVGAAYLVHFSLLMLQRGGLISLLFPNPLLKLFFSLGSSHLFILLHYRTQKYNTDMGTLLSRVPERVFKPTCLQRS